MSYATFDFKMNWSECKRQWWKDCIHVYFLQRTQRCCQIGFFLIKVARFARHVAKWDFLSDFQTLCMYYITLDGLKYTQKSNNTEQWFEEDMFMSLGSMDRHSRFSRRTVACSRDICPQKKRHNNKYQVDLRLSKYTLHTNHLVIHVWWA